MPTKVTFIDKSDAIPEIFFPYPAARLLPQWYKDLSPWAEAHPDSNNYYSKLGTQTAKRCIPMFDALSSGYLIPLPFDIHVSKRTDGSIEYEWPDLMGDSNPSVGVTFHSKDQISTYKKAEPFYDIPKLITPWAFSTPRGYSMLFIPPMNRDDLKIEVFSGIIDTDKFNSTGSFPFLLSDPNFEGLIPAGTPFAQAIPFKREDFEMRMGDDSDRKKTRLSDATVGRFFKDGYRKIMHSKKSYK